MKHQRIILRKAFLLPLLILFSCSKLVEVKPPSHLVTDQIIFGSDSTAKVYLSKAYESLYFTMSKYLSVQTAAYTDDLQMLQSHQSWADFARSRVAVENSFNLAAWKGLYELVYMANLWLNRTVRSHLSDSVAKQITGEFLFLRAYAYYWLVQLYGPVPYINQHDPIAASKANRTAIPAILNNMRADLSEASVLLDWQTDLPENFQATKAAVLVLLARIELMTGNYAAALTSTEAIIQSSLYQLEKVQDVFTTKSRETIWQLKTPKGITDDAITFIPQGNRPPNFIFRASFIQTISPDDQRFMHWISCASQNSSSCFPYKYKFNGAVSPERTEHLVQFRLAELVLMQAELYWRLGKPDAALQFLNLIRSRAGLQPVEPPSGEAEMQQLLLDERRRELFTENGLRLYDLKRTGLIEQLLQPLKPDWKAGGEFLPIPGAEIRLNANLTQNAGY